MINIRLNLTLAAVLLLASWTPAPANSAEPSVKEEVKRLSALLKSDASRKEKADACRELARIGTSDAVDSLASLLPNEELSHMARYGLETIPSSRVDKVLREAMGTLQGRPLVGVIGSLGARRDAKAGPALTKLLANSDTDVAQAAARALGSIGNSSAAEALERALTGGPSPNQLAICEGLFRCAENFEATGHRKQALAIYDRLRATSAPHQVHTGAWRGAILTRGEQGLPLLLEALRSDDFSLFDAAVRTSQEMPGHEITSALGAELGKMPADRQIVLSQALGKRAGAEALPFLFDLARKGQQNARLAAIRALPEIADPLAVPVLVELTRDHDEAVAKTAVEALGGLPGKEADAAVLAMFSREGTDRRILAMDLIVRRRLTGAIPKVLLAAEDLEPRVRVAAFQKLGELAGPAQIPSVLRILERTASAEDIDGAEHALIALAAKAPNPNACADSVVSWLPRVNSAKQCALLRVLTSIGGSEALRTVRKSLNNPDLDVHEAAVRSLSLWPTPDAAPDLLALARKSGGLAGDNVLALRGYLRFASQPDVPAAQRLVMCREVSKLVEKAEEKRLLLAALGGIHLPESLALINPFIDQPETAQEAGNAVVTVAENILKGKDAAKLAPKLIEPLQKVARGNPNADLAKRAQALLDQAQKKGAGN